MFTAEVLCVLVLTVAAGLAAAYPPYGGYTARAAYRGSTEIDDKEDNVPSSKVEEYFRAQSVPSSDNAAAYYPYIPREYYANKMIDYLSKMQTLLRSMPPDHEAMDEKGTMEEYIAKMKNVAYSAAMNREPSTYWPRRPGVG